MRIITTKKQKEALNHLETIRKAITSYDRHKLLLAICDLADVIYIVGGKHGLEEAIKESDKELKRLSEEYDKEKGEKDGKA